MFEGRLCADCVHPHPGIPHVTVSRPALGVHSRPHDGPGQTLRVVRTQEMKVEDGTLYLWASQGYRHRIDRADACEKTWDSFRMRLDSKGRMQRVSCARSYDVM